MSQVGSRHPSAVDARFLGAALGGFALLGASLSFLVWVRGEILREGYRTHDLRTALTEERQRAADLRLERAAVLRPARLAGVARALELDAPTSAQLISVESP